MPGHIKNMRTRRMIPWFSAAAITLLTASATQAEEPGINPRGKGITGGALLGAELVLALEAAFDVQPTWAYIVGGIGGAAAGGVGGYFVEEMDSPKPAYYMLAAGMALVIPTTVAVLQATSYEAPDDYTSDDVGPGTGPAAEPPGAEEPPGGAVTVTAPEASLRPMQPRRHVPLSLVDLHGGTLSLSVPAVEVRPMYSLAEVKEFGVEQRTELRLPVFRATF